MADAASLEKVVSYQGLQSFTDVDDPGTQHEPRWYELLPLLQPVLHDEEGVGAAV